MIYEQNCYNLNDNLIKITIKNIPNNFIRLYDYLLEIFK